MFPDTRHHCWLVVTGNTGGELGWFLSEAVESLGGYQLRVCPSQGTGHETLNKPGTCEDYQGSFTLDRTKPAPKGAGMLCPSLHHAGLEHPLALGKSYHIPKLLLL